MVVSSADTLPHEYVESLAIWGLRTAYFGLLHVGLLKAGETVVISGAAGSVGTAAIQIAKLKGAKVIGIAGGIEKCRWVESLGADTCLDYKSKTFKEDYDQKVGKLDVYIDGVGGEALDLAMTHLNQGARIVIMGSIGNYNDSSLAPSVNYLPLLFTNSRMEGFTVMKFASHFSEADKEVKQWKRDGKVKILLHVEEGLEICPRCLQDIFKGANKGKMIVKVSSKEAGSL